MNFNIELKKKQLFRTIIDIWDKKKHHFIDKFFVAKSAALTNFFDVFFVCFMMFRSLVDENLSKNGSSTTQNGNCENFIEFYLKKKLDLIDDEPTKKQVYLTFYRKFPKKKQKKNGLF